MNTHYHSHISSLIVFFVLFLPLAFLNGQNIIKEVELEDFFEENEIYPFDFIHRSSPFFYKMHTPTYRLSENDFVMVWRADDFHVEERILVRYNLLLEEEWKVEFELRKEEEIEYIFHRDTLLYLLTIEYDLQQKEHRALARSFSLATGDKKNTEILFSRKGDWQDDLFIAGSPDMSRIMVYYYDHTDQRKKSRTFFDYIHPDGSLGERTIRTNFISYKMMDQRLRTISMDTIPLPDIPKLRPVFLGTLIDDDGKVYISYHQKPETLKQIQYDPVTKSQRELAYDQFPRFWEDIKDSDILLPRSVAKNQRLYAAYANQGKRQLSGKQIKGFQVVTFDFQTNEVNLSRKVDINSTVLIQISKARDQAGLRPINKFRNYRLQESIELPDGSFMLITQKILEENYSSRTNAYFEIGNRQSMNFAYELEDLILFLFDPEGNFRRMIVVPTSQQIENDMDQIGWFYEKHLDWENTTLHLLTHEDDGDNFKDPKRLFYRKIDLRTGEVGERVQVFDHKRRKHLFAKSFTTWLNNNVVTTLMHAHTSISTKSYLLSIRLD